VVLSSSVREISTEIVFFVVVAEFGDRHDGGRRRVDVVLRCPFDSSPEILEFAEELESIHLLEPLLLQKMLMNECLILAECLLSELFSFDDVLGNLGEVLGIFGVYQVEAVLVYDLWIVLADVEHLGFLHGQELVKGDLRIHVGLIVVNGGLWELQSVVVVVFVVPKAERVATD